MNYQPAIAPNAGDGMAAISQTALFATGRDPAVLDVIADRHCALACWERSLPRALETALSQVDLGRLTDIRATIDLVSAESDIAALLGMARYPALLAPDIAALARLHGAVLDAESVTIRVEIVDNDACRRFHADYVTTRLITTYAGQGTQWIHTDRPDAVRQVATGAVAIFKGRLLLDDPPILHRSPPVAGSGEKRLLLVIDPADQMTQ